MAVQVTPPTQAQAGYDAYAADDERGYGWVMFAGRVRRKRVGDGRRENAGSLNTWGWVVLCIA